MHYGTVAEHLRMPFCGIRLETLHERLALNVTSYSTAACSSYALQSLLFNLFQIPRNALVAVETVDFLVLSYSFLCMLHLY